MYSQRSVIKLRSIISREPRIPIIFSFQKQICQNLTEILNFKEARIFTKHPVLQTKIFLLGTLKLQTDFERTIGDVSQK